MAGAPLMTLATGRMKRRTLLIALMGIFTLGNLLSAIASDYAMLMAARVITSLNHGAFFGVGRSEEHTSELQSLMRISYAVFCLKKKKTTNKIMSTTSSLIRTTTQKSRP